MAEEYGIDFELLEQITVTNLLQKEKIPYKNHKKWFANHYQEYSIIDNVGFVRKDNDGYISICLKLEKRNQGIGQKLLAKTTGKAIILLNNQPSLYCFTKAGYKIKGFYLEKP